MHVFLISHFLINKTNNRPLCDEILIPFQYDETIVQSLIIKRQFKFQILEVVQCNVATSFLTVRAIMSRKMRGMKPTCPMSLCDHISWK